MNILGISCHYHDAAACLIQDGAIAAAAQEERFSRRKNDPGFPRAAAHFCVQAAGCSILDIDYLAFYEKPYLKFARTLMDHLAGYPRSLPHFLRTMPHWLQDRLILPQVCSRDLAYDGPVLFVKHHLSHAASAFLVSPFEKAAILTVDSVGEWATATLGAGEGNSLKIMKEMRYPDSLGLLYTAVTTYLGFEANEGEGKVMGLAGYGKPRHLDLFNKMVEVYPDGSIKIDQRYFGFNTGSRMYSPRFVEAFGRKRSPGEKIEERHCDIAATLQKFTEDALVLMARHLHRETGMENLCLAGGVFLNCVANSRIMEDTPFRNIYIQPAAGDSGGAIGAAAYVYHSMLGNPRKQAMASAYLGPEYTREGIRRALVNAGLAFEELDDESLFKRIAGEIARNKVAGWFQGRMEIGPRALGNRSILADPRDPGMKDHLNITVKHREPFRPFAPAVLEERASEYFDLNVASPFMLLSPRVKAEKQGVIPSVTHVDGTARVQTVNRQTNPRFWQLISEFGDLTGVPVLLNTSFNLRGEPVVCTPEDAISCFLRSSMDCLVLGNCIVTRGA